MTMELRSSTLLTVLTALICPSTSFIAGSLATFGRSTTSHHAVLRLLPPTGGEPVPPPLTPSTAGGVVGATSSPSSDTSCSSTLGTPSRAILARNRRSSLVARGAAEAMTTPAEDLDEAGEFDGVWVVMNGLPGKMGVEVAAACLRKGFRIAPYALSGKTGGEMTVDDLEGGKVTQVKLVASSDEAGCEEVVSELRRRCQGGRLVVVDYTHPSAVNDNANFYARHGLDFVMGTTGGDRDALVSVAEDSGVYAVIAPNMGKQIVALQSAIDIMAREYPESFAGYRLEITESHQSTKADTSGTARALAADFSTLTGEDYDVEAINKKRERDEQLAFGVPEDHIDGHAFHTYSLKSNDGTVEFQFRHNVCGRRLYAEGTADTVEFLAKKASCGAEQRVYNMLDVLREGGV